MRCLVIRGEDEVLQFPLPEKEARLGSDPANDLVVPLVGVSRFHARLVPDPIALRLFDLDSKNGLLVKGKRLREVALLPGVVVRAGAATISLEESATSDVELAVEFPAARARALRPAGIGGIETETVTAKAESADGVRFLRDLEKLGREGRPQPDAEEVLERLERLLTARGVALFREGPSAREVVLSSGEAPGEGVLEALACAQGVEGRPAFLNLGGEPAAWAPPSSAGGLGVLVLLRPGASLAPWQKEILSFGLEHLGDPKSALAREVEETVRRKPRLVYPDGMVPGSSAAMRGLLGQIAKTVRSRVDVLVLGETGTGKELIARLIHASGPTSDGPFVAINCAAVPRELLEAELFGHTRGAFTGALRSRLGKFRQAHGGTLFLDEISELPPPVQGKLLRVLQERVVDVLGSDTPEPVDVRLVAATNQDLRARIRDQEFREDLFYRLAVFEVTVPPLRERLEDLPLLVEHFVNRFAGGRDLIVTDALLQELARRPWPGNVRELENAIERAVILCREAVIRIEDLPPAPGPANPTTGPDPLPGPRASPGAGVTAAPAAAAPEEWPPLPPDGLSLVELERRVIERVLALKQWNISQSARYLGVPRHILTYRMEKHGLRRPT